MKLSNNKILITGATSGIGKALTEQFLALGNKIIAIGRNQNKLEALGKLDPRITPFNCDLSSPSDLDRLLSFIKEEHTDLNILINNAGNSVQHKFLRRDVFVAQY